MAIGGSLFVLVHTFLLFAVINTILAYCAIVGFAFTMLNMALLHRRWRFDQKRMRIALSAASSSPATSSPDNIALGLSQPLLRSSS
jgi:hypothetical protein